MSAEFDEVRKQAKGWGGRHVLYVPGGVVGKVSSVDEVAPFSLIVHFEEGHSFFLEERSLGNFVPLNQEMVGFFASLQDGIKGLVLISAKMLHARKVDPETGIKLIEAALSMQLRAVRATK